MDRLFANSNKGKIYIGEYIDGLTSKKISEWLLNGEKNFESNSCVKDGKVLYYGYYNILGKKFVVLPFELWKIKEIEETNDNKIVYCNYIETYEKDDNINMEIPKNGRIMLDTLFIKDPSKNIEVYNKTRGRKKRNTPEFLDKCTV